MKDARGHSLGLAAALATVVIWAVFLLGTRSAVSGKFTVEEVLVLRLGTASLITLPFMLKLGVVLRGQNLIGTFMLTVGASAIFPYVISTGLFYAPASDAGALAPGMLPFWTALFAVLLAGEKLGRLRLTGLTLILGGAVLIGLWQIISGSDPNAWKGHLLFLLGSCLWAVYSVYFRQSGLSPVHGLVIGLFWGTLGLMPFLLWTGKVNFSTVSAPDIVYMAVLQGVIIAVLALVLYSFAVRKLGAAQTAAFGALTPVLALIGGAVFLNETITFVKIIGVLLVAIGVVMASGSLERRPISDAV
ncbi:MAG: DMT family transporter [Marinovum sp.]|nr:DMT family transporter [Marinovum sp.]MBT6508106.1 DMT family transporter [Marinovum sp.]